MNIDILNEKINEIFEDTQGYIKTQADNQMRHYVHAMLNQKTNYFIAEYVKNNLANMIEEIWNKQFDQKSIYRLLNDELEGSLMQRIDCDSKYIYVKYLHEEIKKKVKKDTKGIKAVSLDDFVNALEAA